MKRYSHQARQSRHESGGFNLIEIMIASLILLMSLAGAVKISTRSGVIGFMAGQRYQKEARIDEDLAQIQRINERFTCVSGTCTVFPDNSGDISKNDYFPDPLPTNGTDSDNNGIADSQEAAIENFQDRCKNASSDLSLVAPLKAILDARAQPDGLARSVTIDSANAHRYTVTYTDTDTNEVLRQVNFSPAAVAWCPRV